MAISRRLSTGDDAVGMVICDGALRSTDANEEQPKEGTAWCINGASSLGNGITQPGDKHVINGLSLLNLLITRLNEWHEFANGSVHRQNWV